MHDDLIAACRHTVTQARKCIACGQTTTAVHDKPCRECAHFRNVVGGSICRKHLMAVLPDMHVSYRLHPKAEFGESGLCFVAQETVDE